MATSRSRLAIRKYRGQAVLGTSDVVPGAPEPTASTPYPRTVLIPQWRVEQILGERLGELGVAVEYGSELAGLKQDSDGVHASLQTASGSESDSFSYAIGCDGASSTVRKLLEIGFLGQTDETVRMLTADVEMSGLDRDFWHWWPSADGKLLALCPLAATDTFQLQVGVAPDTAGELPLAQIQALVEERSGRTDIRIRRVEWQSIWRFNVRMVDRYRAGQVFLAGDSEDDAVKNGPGISAPSCYWLAWYWRTPPRPSTRGFSASCHHQRASYGASTAKLGLASTRSRSVGDRPHVFRVRHRSKRRAQGICEGDP